MIKELLYQGNKIAYNVFGEGKPVVLIHGFGEDSTVWRNQIAVLKTKYQLILPDLPGSGQSAMINDMSMEGIAEAVIAILDAEKIYACPVIGHSMGGYISLALLEKYPERISSLGLFHSSAYADSEDKKQARRKGIDFIREHGAKPFLETTIPNLFSQKTKDENPELVKEQVALSDNFLAPALVSYYESMMKRPDRTDLLRKITVPVLFIIGEFDAAVPFKDSLEQCHLPENSYIHIFRNSAHMGMLEEPDKSDIVIEKFLSDI